MARFNNFASFSIVNMNQQSVLSVRLELIWWVFTAMVVFGILFPIYSIIAERYPFYFSNALFIIVFITFTRLIFLLQYTIIAYRQALKFGFILLSLSSMFFFINELNYFQTYLDERGIEPFLGAFSLTEQTRWAAYIKNEVLFFGVGSIISAIVLPFRLLISIWRLHNKGTV